MGALSIVVPPGSGFQRQTSLTNRLTSFHTSPETRRPGTPVAHLEHVSLGRVTSSVCCPLSRPFLLKIASLSSKEVPCP